MKSIFNFIKITLITTTLLIADYIPLSDSVGHEKSWVLFGVTGLRSTGAGSGSASGNFSITDDIKYNIIDINQDGNFTDGLIDPIDSNLSSFGKLKSLTLPYIQVRIDTTGAVFNSTEPKHTMYVCMEKDGGPDFVITYSSSLENRVVEYTSKDDNTSVHRSYLNIANDYRNPAYGELTQSIIGMPLSTLSEVRDIVDFNLSNNPLISAYYDKSSHQEVATSDDFLRLYSYNAQDTRWDLFDTRNDDSVNDFLELEKGKSYWGQIDGPLNTKGGVVLGDSNISTLEYNKHLAEGWNLISFSDDDSIIKKASTGLILTLTTDIGTIKIWNSSANSAVEINTIQGGGESKILTSCLSINETIKQAKIDASMPQNFNLKAFPVTTTKIILISDNRFLVNEEINDTISAITTLTGAIPYKVNPQFVDAISDIEEMNATTVLDTDSFGAMSKYAEYSMIIEPLVGAGTASESLAKVELQSTADDASDTNLITIDTNLSTVATALSLTTGNATFLSTAIDTDYDSSMDLDKVLIASLKPFYIKDHTFTRVFNYTDEDNISKLRVYGTGLDGEIIVDGNQTANEYATAIDNNYNINAKSIGNKIVIFTTVKNGENFGVKENIELTTADQLQNTTTDSNLSKGAIKGVYSLENFVKASINTVSPDLIDDLNFNPVHSSGYIYRGPLYSMRDAGFEMKAMVSGNVDISDGSISWESVDLTRGFSNLFDSHEYTLFQTDSSAGYWVYLEAKTEIEPTLLDVKLKLGYSSSFNRDGTSYNDISGTLSLNLDSEDNENSMVSAIIDGHNIELRKSKTSSYHIANINSHELSLLAGNNYNITLNIANTKGSNLLNKDIGQVIDFIKPSKPIIDIQSGSTTVPNDDNGTTVTLKSTADATGFYVFNNQIPDYKPSSALNKVGEFEKDSNNQYSFCTLAGINRLITADQEAYHLQVIAVDGVTKKLGGGNASDIVYQDYIPILKDSIKLTDRNNEGESNSTIIGKIYKSDCTYFGVQGNDVNYGVELTSEDENETVKIVYKPKGIGMTNPITLFFDGDANITAKVTYSDVYVGSIVYLDVNETVYSYELIDTGNTSGDPIYLNTDANVTKRPAQKL